MSDPIIYGPGFSTYVRSVRLALEEKGVPYRLEEINILEGAQKAPEYLARHPFGKVPAFEHDGLLLYETGPILRYVDEAFDGPSLQPGDLRARAHMNQVLSIVDAYTYPACISAVVIQRVVVPMTGGSTDEAAVAEAVPQAETAMQALETVLDSNDYFAGAALSLADLHVVPIMDYFSQTPEGKAALAKTPNLARWFTAMGGRDSVKKTKPQLG